MSRPRLTYSLAPRALATTALIAVAVAHPAQAQWALDGAAACTEAHTQGPVAIAADGAGGVVLAWADARLSSRIAIYAQRLDASGVPMWSDDGVPVCTTQNSRGGVVVLPAGGGGVVIFWHDGRSNNQDDIYAQRLDAQGVPLWTVNGLALSTANLDQRYPVAVVDGAFGIAFQRGFNVAWAEEDVDHAVTIRMQHVNLSGAAMWTTAAVGGVTLTAVPRTRSGLAIATDGSPNVIGGPAGAVVAWDEPGAATTSDIYAGRVDYSGTSRWGSNGVAVCMAIGLQLDPDIAAVGGGDVVIAWQDGRNAIADIYAQKLHGTGIAAWLADGMPVCRATGSQSAPKLIADGVGGTLVTWSDARAGTPKVFTQRMDGSGQPAWAVDGLPLCTGDGSQTNPVLVSDTSGGAVVAWIDTRDGGNDVYAQRIDAAGNLLWASDGAPLCRALQSQSSAVLAADGSGGGIAAWIDARNGNNDIYANRASGNGVVTAAPAAVAGAAMRVTVLSSNPTRGTVELALDLPSPANVGIEVLDVRGRVVRALRAGETRAVGRHVIRWDGRDDAGSAVASGVYYVRVRAGTSAAVQRVVEVR